MLHNAGWGERLFILLSFIAWTVNADIKSHCIECSECQSMAKCMPSATHLSTFLASQVNAEWCIGIWISHVPESFYWISAPPRKYSFIRCGELRAQKRRTKSNCDAYHFSRCAWQAITLAHLPLSWRRIRPERNQYWNIPTVITKRALMPSRNRVTKHL